MKIFNQILKQIKKSKNVAVFGHTSADSDCLASISAISFLLEQFGKKVESFIDDETLNPKLNFFNFKYSQKCDFSQFDLCISVDVASTRLLGQNKEGFIQNKNSIVIDHHFSRDLQGTITYVDAKCSSCSEIIYNLLKNAKIKITKDIATKLYAGVSSDTGCFLHDNTTSKTHLTASILIDFGADISLVNYELFKHITLDQYRLRKILDASSIYKDGINYCVVKSSTLIKNNLKTTDVGDYANNLINLDGTKISFTLVEKQKNSYSLSMRAIKGYNVCDIAKVFGGGGHIQASGAYINGDVDEIINNILNECYKQTKGE